MVYTIFMIPVLMMVVGYLMFKYPPKKVNLFVGYRTFKSMKNEKTWKVANRYCGKIWINIGIILFAISLLLFLLFHFEVFVFNENILTIITLLELTIMVITVFLVENKIKNL